VDTIDASLGWLFSIPTLGFCFLLCDGLADVTSDSVALRFRVLRVAFVVAAVLPFFVYLVGVEWLSIPATAALWTSEVVLVLAVWAAGDDDEEEQTGFSAERIRRRRAPATQAVTQHEEPPGDHAAAPTPISDPPDGTDADAERTWWGGRKKQEQGFSAEAVRERLRREREEREAREAREAQQAGDG
jgi:hypothetical protein